MRAAVWTELNKIEVMDVERPSLGPNEVQIKVHATGMCITDLHVYTGQFAYGKPPHVLGHEIAGEICEVANPEHGYLLGTRVTVEISVGCGMCGFCRSGRPNLCPDMTEIGFTPHQGGYAEYVNVPVGNIVEIPDNVSYEEAGIIESIVCPMGALIRNQINFGETVAVFGVGPAGLAFIQGAKLLGAGKVIAIGRSDFPLQRAKNFGADIREHIKIFKEISGDYLYDGDCYRLTGQTAALPKPEDNWTAFQFTADKASSLVFVFKMGLGKQAQHFPLKGLNPDTLYKVTAYEGGEPIYGNGGELMKKGILAFSDAKEWSEIYRVETQDFRMD